MELAKTFEDKNTLVIRACFETDGATFYLAPEMVAKLPKKTPETYLASRVFLSQPDNVKEHSEVTHKKVWGNIVELLTGSKPGEFCWDGSLIFKFMGSGNLHEFQYNGTVSNP